jgi:hypothetical protein
MLKLYDVGENFIIRNSLFDIRYSFRVYRKLIVLKLPITKELAKYLRFSVSHRCEIFT